MDKKSRGELLEVIENQNTKILSYRHKLHDIIEAYKGACKEKEALENSLKALRSNKTTDSNRRLSSDHVEDHPLSTTDQSQDDKVSMLSEALETLTNEKTRIEGCLVAEKKKIKQDFDLQTNKLHENEELYQKELGKLQISLQELKWNMGKQQKQQEEENRNHVLMLRELQSLLSNERDSKEKLQTQYDKLRKQSEFQIKFQKESDQNEKIISSLRKELNFIQEKLKISEMSISKPSPILIELKQEMADMKIDHQQAVKEEHKRANFAEDNLKSIANASEERVTGLELRVSELSEMVGNYDRLRQQDQQAILKLKDRVAQLDLENTVLAQAAGIPDSAQDYAQLDVQILVDKIMKIKKVLKIKNDQSEFPLDLSEFFNFENTEPESDIHSLCHQELELLRDEFETYKTRAQTVLKSKSAKQQDSSNELEFLQRQVIEQKTRLQASKSQLQTSNEYRKNIEEKLQATIHELKTRYRHEISTLESEHTSKLVELEQQVQKQRERTMALLEEKDKELQLVKGTFINQTLLQSGMQSMDHESSLETENDTQVISDSIADMLSQTMASKKGEQKILHYVQEIARKDVEIANLRRGKHQIESSLRELQCFVATKDDELELLETKVRRFKSSQNEEGINMEYLKNVILRYVLCKDIDGRKHMLNAIAAILHFTGRELDQARKSSINY